MVDRLPSTLDTHVVAGDSQVARMIASLVLPGAFQVGPGSTPTLDSDVVTSASVVSLAPQTVVYQIAQGATWSDGVPISAADFIYAWKTGRSLADAALAGNSGPEDSPVSTLGYRDISSVTGSGGGRTVTVVFRTPFADWESLFSDLLPAHLLESPGVVPANALGPVGDATKVSGGPFEIASWSATGGILLRPNPRWWGSPPPVGQIAFVESNASEGAAGGSFSVTPPAGDLQVDSTYSFGPALLSKISAQPLLDSAVHSGSTVVQLVFNTHSPILSAPLVRRGIAHFIHRSALVAQVGGLGGLGVSEADDHLVAPGGVDYEEDAAGFHHAKPARATRDLIAAGLATSSSGTWMSAGVPLSLSLIWPASDPFAAFAANAVASQLDSAGLHIVPSPVTDLAALRTALASGSYSLAIVPVPTSAFPTLMRNAFTPKDAGAGPGGFADLGGVDDPQLNLLFAQAAQELSPGHAESTYQSIDSLLWTDMPTLPLFAEPQLAAWSAQISGISVVRSGSGPLWGLLSWSVLPTRPTRAAG